MEIPAGAATYYPYPFTAFSELVCRLNYSRFTPLQREVFDYFFYGFSLPGKYRRYAGDVMHAAKGFGEFKDYNLPRERYYTTCNARQMESIHICYEMKAYTNLREVGPLLLGDASQERLCQRFNVQPVANSLFTLLNPFQMDKFLNGIGTPSSMKEGNQRELAAYGESLGRALGAGLCDSFHRIPHMNWEGALIHFPLEKEWFTTTKCIDMRQPDTRRWFFERYRRGVEGWPGYGYDAADVVMWQEGNDDSESNSKVGFIQMLPSLCDPDLGGRLITQVIGADLRRCGTECLVYPSARCDTFAMFQDGSLVDAYGWNLVDYRNAGIPKSPAEEGIVYAFAGDIVLDSDGKFEADSPHNIERRSDIGRQVKEIRETTGREPRAVFYDPYNPWIPSVLPLRQIDGNSPLSFELDVSRELAASARDRWPYKVLEVYDGDQRGSFTIEGVQRAHDERETTLTTEFIRSIKSVE